MKRISRISSLLVVLSIFSVQIAMGASLYPGSMNGTNTTGAFTYTLDPGEEITDSIIIKNTSEVKEYLAIGPTDAVMTAEGSFALKRSNETQVGIGIWAQPEVNTFTVEPGKTKEIKFILHVPENTAPGDYAGGLVVTNDPNAPGVKETATIASDSGSMGMVVQIRTGLRIYLNVEGERRFDFLWDSEGENIDYSHLVKDESHIFNYYFNNKGNISLDVNAKLHLKNLFFDLETVDANLGTIIAGSTSKPQIIWTKVPPVGLITATTIVSYNINSLSGTATPEEKEKYAGEMEKTITFFIIPMKESIVALLVFIVTFILMMYKHRKFQKIIASCKTLKISHNTSLVNIAEDHHLDLNLLIKINKIKSPYAVTKGSSILIPKNEK